MNFGQKAVPLFATNKNERKHTMWSNLLWVGAGGFVGSVLRYSVGLGIAVLTATRGGIRFPLATLAVNVLGSFAIGMLLRYVEQGSAQHLLGVVGFCGGFTTFSTFSLESVRLLREGHTSTALLYISISLVLCIGATFLGMTIKTTR